MTKEDLVKEFDRLIEAHYSEEIDSRDEWLREIINLKHKVVKKLTIPVVVGQSEQLCDHPRSERSYIGQNMLRCNKCGKEFS